MAYDRVVTELNSHRLAGTSYPLLANFSEAARASGGDVGYMKSDLLIFLTSLVRPRGLHTHLTYSPQSLVNDRKYHHHTPRLTC